MADRTGRRALAHDVRLPHVPDFLKYLSSSPTMRDSVTPRNAIQQLSTTREVSTMTRYGFETAPADIELRRLALVSISWPRTGVPLHKRCDPNAQHPKKLEPCEPRHSVSWQTGFTAMCFAGSLERRSPTRNFKGRMICANGWTRCAVRNLPVANRCLPWA